MALAAGAGGVAGATTTLECGLFRDYVAPDPVGDVAGAITFGVNGNPEDIAADATLVPPIDTALPSLTGGVPTCLTVTRDAGVITSLAFAPSGTISGTVVLVADLFGPGQDAYVIADRLFTPVEAVAANDGLAALIKSAADSGMNLVVMLAIDTSTGFPTGFAATTTLSGPVVLLSGGDITIGTATLPSSVIRAAARADLEEAANLGVPATVVVDGIGTLDNSSAGGVMIDITLSVTFAAPAVTPSPTEAALPNTAMTRQAPEPSGFAALAGAVCLLTVLAIRRQTKGPR
jgi:hypothetical protein